MKHLLLSFLLVIGFGSCDPAASDSGTKFGIQILKMDGCEYVVYVDDIRGGTAMVHHANCHNPIHKQLK